MLRAQSPSTITKNASQGIRFVKASCQRIDRKKYTLNGSHWKYTKVPKSEAYLNRTLAVAKKGEVKRGEVVGE